MPWLATPHSDEETADWMAGVVLRDLTVLVAHEGDVVQGLLALAPGWVEHLYVDPAAQGRGVGHLLLSQAQRRSPSGLQLWVFTRNTPARRFYERAGFRLVEQGDGRGNEEREPDSRYRWP
ncbi:GNAT family N-acetyltransferase [Kineococcus sp. R8]|nr:GNAT family N-acetyltransferase [Kineococcus siccus]